MPVQFERWYKSEVTKIRPIAMDSLLFQNDDGSNLIGLITYQDGAETSVSGTVTGAVTLADGTVVEITGALRSGKPYIVLTDDCYTIPGLIRISISVGGDQVGLLVGQVYQVTTGNVAQ